MALTSTRIDTVQTIFHSEELAPLLGAEATDTSYTFNPWKWDERIWTTAQLENSDLTIPSLTDASVGSITTDKWLSGVGDVKVDCEVIKTIISREESIDRWTVLVRHGNYFTGKYRRYLFADRSTIQYVDNTNNNPSPDVNKLLLTDIPRHGSPISATIWERNSYGSPFIHKYISKKCQFTGWYTEDGEEETETDGEIVWANVDTTKDEFVVVWPNGISAPTLWFNKDFTFLVGKESIAEDDDLYMCDYLGISDGTVGQTFLTKYFPIINNNEITLYYDNYSDSYFKDIDYEVDYDRGEIKILIPQLAGKRIYIRYRVTVEVEYESEDCNDYRTASYINLNPMSSIVNRGFIYLTEQELRVSRLELRADTIEITDDAYGPLELGTDYCFVIATAYNMYNQPVPGAEISFYMDYTTDGYLNGIPATGNPDEPEPVTVITDANGEARILYSVPRSIEAVGQYTAHASSDNEITLVHTNGITEDNLNNLFVFYVFDDDPHWLPWIDVTQPDGQIGSGGRKVVVYRQTFTKTEWATSTEYYSGSYEHPASFVYVSGSIYKCISDHTSDVDNHPTGGSGAAYWVKIGMSDYSWGGGVASDSDKFWSDSAYNPVTPSLGAYIPLRPTELDGSNLVFNDELGNPINLPQTFEPRNSGISDWIVGYNYVVDDNVIGADGRRFKCLVDHLSTNTNQPPHPGYWQRNEAPGNLVAYWVAGGRQIPIHAKCESYFYDGWINSNDIEIRISIPEHMSGVYINEQLQEVPYGFRLRDSAGSMSSALTGITFLGINF